MALDYLITKNEKTPAKIVVHALGGVGKSTFGINAAKENNGIIILGEDGINKLKEAEGIPRVEVEDWDYSTNNEEREAELTKNKVVFKKVLKDLMLEKHDYKCLVIDTLDAFIPRLDKWVVKNNYGGDPKKADAYKTKFNDYVREMCSILAALDYLNKKRGMEIVVLVHSIVNNHRDPSSEAWKRWELNLPGGDKTSLGSALYDWADLVLYASYDVQGDTKTKERVAYTEWSPIYDAKNRFGMPEKVVFDYKNIKKQIGGK